MTAVIKDITDMMPLAMAPIKGIHGKWSLSSKDYVFEFGPIKINRLVLSIITIGGGYIILTNKLFFLFLFLKLSKKITYIFFKFFKIFNFII